MARRRIAALLTMAACGFLAAWFLTALAAPSSRTVRRMETRETLGLQVQWGWKIRITQGNAVWPAGTELEAGRPVYPYAGGAVLVATPEGLVRSQQGPTPATLSYEVRWGAVREGAVVWDRPLQSGRVEGSEGTLRAPPLEVEPGALRGQIEAINGALGLQGPYQPALIFRAVLAVGGSSGATAQVEPVVLLHPEGFQLPEADRSQQQEQVQEEVTQEVVVPYPLTHRLRDRSGWLLAAVVAGVGVFALRRRPFRAGGHEGYFHRRWIVPGKVDLRPDVRIVELDSVGALVSLAQEIGSRVVHDPRVGYVLADHQVSYVYRPRQGPRLGELLARLSVLTPRELEATAGNGVVQLRGRPLGERLVLLGLVDPVSVACALAHQYGRMFLEPDHLRLSPAASRLFLPVAWVGQRPDGKQVVATCDPTVPAEALEQLMGEPVEVVVVRPERLVGASGHGSSPHPERAETEELRLGRRELRAAREQGVTLSLLLWVCGWSSESDPAAWRVTGRTAYRRALSRGEVHPDALQLAVAVLSEGWAGRVQVPDAVSWMRRALRWPEAVCEHACTLEEDQWVQWCYISEATLGRLRRLRAALQAFRDAGL